MAPPTTTLLNLTAELLGLILKLVIAKLRCWLCPQSCPSCIMLKTAMSLQEQELLGCALPGR